MEAAIFVALFVSIWASLNSGARQSHRAMRQRDLARYKHHPDANLLILND